MSSGRARLLLPTPFLSTDHLHCPTELAAVVRRFSQVGIQDFLTLTLAESKGILYVGAREALFALSLETLELQSAVRGRRSESASRWRVLGVRMGMRHLELVLTDPSPPCP